MGEGRGQTLLNQPSHFLGQDLDPPEPGVGVQGCGGLSQLLPGSPEDLLFPSHWDNRLFLLVTPMTCPRTRGQVSGRGRRGNTSEKTQGRPPALRSQRSSWLGRIHPGRARQQRGARFPCRAAMGPPAPTASLGWLSRLLSAQAAPLGGGQGQPAAQKLPCL